MHLLIKKGKIIELLPPSNPRAKRYDPTKICLYSNSPGHATEECWALHYKIQNLIENGELNKASNIEVTTVEEGKIKMKGLVYPPEMESLDEVVAMITNLNETQSGPLII